MKKVHIVKRIVSIALIVALLGTAVLTLSSCGLFAKKVKGTEAAKILLARERLDSDAVGQKVGVFETNDSGSNGGILSFFGANSLLSQIRPSTVKLTGAASDAKKTSDSIVWEKFGDYSDEKDNYTQFITPIDMEAAETAKTIATIKENVGVTDKWVNFLGTEYMLIVDENSEIIIERSDNDAYITIGIRYTTEDAKCVYEMYDFWSEGGESGLVRNMCIPGEHYEYMYQHSSGVDDYFIADKSKGYWEMNRFSFTEQTALFNLAVVKDGLGYGTTIDLYVDEDGSLYIPEGSIGLSAAIFLPNEDRDLYDIAMPYGDYYQIDLKMSNVESGITSLAVYGNEVDEIYSEDYADVGMIYAADEFNNVVVNLDNGKTLTPGDVSGDITYKGARTNYSPSYNGDCYTGEIMFTIEANSRHEAFDKFEEFLAANGIKVRSDRATVEAAYAHCQLLYENFDVTEWYGYQLNSMDNLLAAEAALDADFEKYQKIYDEVKDNETVAGLYNVSPFLNFESITLVEKGSSSYSGGVLKINGMSAKMDSSDLLENGKEYTLQIGLARLDAEGNISKVNAVALNSENAVTGVYEGGDFTLSQSGDFLIPTVMTEGEYMVVAYFATADDKIRVTEMLPVAFIDIAEGKLESDVMDITVKRDGEALHVRYEVKLEEWVTCDELKTSYTYEELESALIRGVISKGYPLNDVTVQTADGNDLSVGSTYGAGIYRIKFLITSEGTMVEAYMYCDFTPR